MTRRSATSTPIAAMSLSLTSQAGLLEVHGGTISADELHHPLIVTTVRVPLHLWTPLSAIIISYILLHGTFQHKGIMPQLPRSAFISTVNIVRLELV